MAKKIDRVATGTGRGRDRGEDGRFRPRVPVVKGPEMVGDKEKPLRPRECRGYLRRELARSFRGIVDGFVKQAESGSVQHLKLATELLGEAAEPRRRKGSAVLLLEKLGIGDSGCADERS